MPSSTETKNGNNTEDIIDMETFNQIKEMDEDDNDEFSRSLVEGFLDQAKATFDDMDKAIAKKDLGELSGLGHFLKGSSATLGLIKIKDHCEQIQHYGSGKDQTGLKDVPDSSECLESIKKSLSIMRVEFTKAEKYFKREYPPLT